MIRTPNRETRRSRPAILLAALAAALIAAPAALAHVERASYWPDPGEADDVSAGGAVPDARSLASALDDAETGETRVVCPSGQPLAYRADVEVSRRPDLEVSRERVERLERKLKKLRRRIKEVDESENSDDKAKANRLKKRLTQAKLDYQAALAQEELARHGGEHAYQQALAAEQAARANYHQQLGADPSIQRLDAALTDAVANGYVLRPSQPRVAVSQGEADQLRDLNARLLALCSFNEIQPAVTASGNNDRVVVMPGTYTEPTSRAVPLGQSDPDASPCYPELLEENDGGDPGALSYAYQATCPNDQNLIAVIGRQPMNDQVEQPPLENRRGIPDEGPCIRCNLQLEGSGIKPDDVVVENGNDADGDGLSEPGEVAKDVILRGDRADGLVLSNFKVRHSHEHGIYVHEVDGYRIERVHSYYNLKYGYLQFTSDHGLLSDCDTKGNGDSGVYPGAAPDTGEQTVESAERLNQQITRCDSHHNTLGYSGTMGNAVHIVDNHFYDNATGIATDSFFAGGHPGFPQDGDLIEDNQIYANNFNPYTYTTDVDPAVPLPVGTGILVAGGNNNTITGNRIYDNWRRGTMLLAVPDVLSGEDPGTSTSFRNQHSGNTMGQAPGGGAMPNGVDFWWDEFPAPDSTVTSPVSTENCWFNNGTYTSDPPPSPAAGQSVPGFLPENCATSFGNAAAYSTKAPVLAECATWTHGQGDDDFVACDWFETPPQPGSAGAAAFRAEEREHMRELAARDVADPACEMFASSFSCEPFDRPSSP